MTILLSKEVSNSRIKRGWGCTEVLLDIYVKTEFLGKENDYTVTCRIVDLASLQPELEIIEVVAHNNNEETLVADALADLLDLTCNYGVKTRVEQETVTT